MSTKRGPPNPDKRSKPRQIGVLKRRRRDSNPRDPCGPTGFQDRRIQPLCHSSGECLKRISRPERGQIATAIAARHARGILAGRMGERYVADNAGDPAGAIVIRHDPAIEPARSLSTLLVYLETGLRLRAGDSADRTYPTGLAEFLGLDPASPTFDLEMLVRGAWAGCAVIEQPAAGGGGGGARGTPCSCARSAVIHVRLLTRALIPVPHRRWPTAPAVAAQAPFWPSLIGWLNPMRAWRDLRAGEIGRIELAAAIAVGVFIANLPLYGVQTLAALYAARRLHLHPVPTVAGSQVSTPPVGPVLVAVAIGVGHLVTHGAWPHLADFDPRHLTFASVGPVLVDWVVGSLIVGVVLAAVALALTAMLFRVFSATRSTHPAAPVPTPARAASEPTA
jgi:uncharacterized protein (DUF2062 family)